MFDMDKKWSLVIALNEISSADLGEKGVRFVRGVTLEFQEKGDLSERQWIAVERVIEYHTPRHDFDPNTMESREA